MKLDKSYKVRVTPEQSREIQELVFKLGGNLQSGDTFVKETHLERLYVSKCLKMSFGLTEHGWSYQEGATIQADDLIALLTDLPKSAENPLQDVELTPEFGSVEPTFKVGSGFYFGLNPKIYIVKKCTDNEIFAADPNDPIELLSLRKIHCCPATSENYERLQATFPDIEFERPALTGNELCRKLLDKGEKYIMAIDDTDTWRIICDYCDDWFTDVVSGKCLKHVTPVNSKGEPLTQAVLDE
jgi:hypothetical protein